ncbi:MAG: hemerythrin domain-containing protein [Rubrivivax sp.]|nr:hemerythrin domain-containing protein [Rubrivivax sp.]
MTVVTTPATSAEALPDTAPGPPADAAPVGRFTGYHEAILQQLEAFGGLAACDEPAARARAPIDETLVFFRATLFRHHEDEERELMPAVVASSAPGEERRRVQAIAAQLTREHREVERAFLALEPSLRRLARERHAVPSGDELAGALRTLVRCYEAHARFEENEFLPLAESILGRCGHMGALGLALHLGRPPEVPPVNRPGS